MQTIPASWVRAFSASLSQLSGRMRAMLEAELLEVDYSDVAEARERVVEIMETYCGLSADAASEIAVEFYDGIREAHLGERLGAEPAVSRRPGGIEGAVRAFAQDLADGKPPEQFRRKCLDRLDYETRLAANECVRTNAERDPAKPRCARVPSGNETCRFCIMLASRGFVYHSEGLAGHAHANCDCVIVPGFEGMTKVEGYDPEYYRDCYAHPENHPEIREALNARRRELYAESGNARKPDDGTELRELIGSIEDLTPIFARRKELAEEMNILAKRAKRMRREERDAAKADWDSLKAEFDAVDANLSLAIDLQSKAVRKAVGKMRTLGPEPGRHASDYFDMSSARAVKQTMEDALYYIPRDWLDTLSRSGMRVQSMRRGSRSYFDNRTNTLHLASDKDKLTAVHEMMHAMERNSAAFFADSEAYFLRRTAGKTIEPLSALTGDGYEPDEEAYDMGGECVHPYAYKIYGDPQTRQFTSFEVASLGVEYLYRKPWTFVNDPELLDFVLHKLKGV